MRARRVGQHGLLVECADAREVEAAYAVLRARATEIGATDIVPAARTVLLDGLHEPGAAADLVAGLSPAPTDRASAERRLVEVPVRYDGPDLAEVARQWRVSPDEVARIHQETEFVVAFCGFAPGFAYCTGLAADLGVRRRTAPRARVPAGSVALAGEFTSVYPTASPGGWQLIGSTDLEVWQPEAERPALLAPGTRVRFRDASSLGSSTQGFRDASSLGSSTQGSGRA
jgi:KipI family sensor histidine kinase inhibitor